AETCVYRATPEQYHLCVEAMIMNQSTNANCARVTVSASTPFPQSGRNDCDDRKGYQCQLHSIRYIQPSENVSGALRALHWLVSHGFMRGIIPISEDFFQFSTESKSARHGRTVVQD